MSSPKSKYIDDKPKFKKRFQKCPQKIQQIFSELQDKAISACDSDDWGYSDKPDLRIGFVYNMIELVPKSDHILIMLRIDNNSLDAIATQLTTISVAEAQELGKPGKRWIEFQVSNNSQVDDAIQLITTVYNHRKQIGWCA